MVWIYPSAGKPELQKRWVRLSSQLIHPSKPPSGLCLCGCLLFCSFCLSKSRMLSVPAEASDNGCYPWARDVGLGCFGRPIGIPLEGMEHVPCERNGLIKWDQLDGHSFRVKYKRIWFLGGLGWDSSWQFMVKDGIRWEENVPLFNFNWNIFVWGKKFYPRTEASQHLWMLFLAPKTGSGMTITIDPPYLKYWWDSVWRTTAQIISRPI